MKIEVYDESTPTALKETQPVKLRMVIDDGTPCLCSVDKYGETLAIILMFKSNGDVKPVLYAKNALLKNGIDASWCRWSRNGEMKLSTQ